MDHIGIDLGSKDSQVCVRNAAGEIVGEWRCRTDRLVASLQDRPRGRVIVETCTEAFRVAALAQRAGHEVRVVAATLVRSLGVGHRGLKNDVRDARVLSEASCRMDLPSVHIPTAISLSVLHRHSPTISPAAFLTQTWLSLLPRSMPMWSMLSLLAVPVSRTARGRPLHPF